jgi:hypothetical protein
MINPNRSCVLAAAGGGGYDDNDSNNLNINDKTMDDGSDPVEKNKRNKSGLLRTMAGCLTLCSSLASQAAASAVLGGTRRPSSSVAASYSLEVRNLVLSTMFWCAMGMIGWYVPRYLLHQKMTTIATKPVYFQVVEQQHDQASIVIIDPLLSEPLVNPATVDCKLFGISIYFYSR